MVRSGVDDYVPFKRLIQKPSAASTIAHALFNAKAPLIITSYLGRNPKAVQHLVTLSEALSIPVFLSCPTTACFPAGHPNFVDISIGMDRNSWLQRSDVILIIDSDIPFIPMHNKPPEDAKIYHIDVDPLKDNIGMFHIDAVLRCKADAETALLQIVQALPRVTELHNERFSLRGTQLAEHYERRLGKLDNAESTYPEDGSFTVQNLLGVVRRLTPEKTLVLNESITNFPLVWDHLCPQFPGSYLTAGSSSLGWGLGAAIGASIGGKVVQTENEMIILVVGDGSFLFGIPSVAFWMARRYETVSNIIPRFSRCLS